MFPLSRLDERAATPVNMNVNGFISNRLLPAVEHSLGSKAPSSQRSCEHVAVPVQTTASPSAIYIASPR